MSMIADSVPWAFLLVCHAVFKMELNQSTMKFTMHFVSTFYIIFEASGKLYWRFELLCIQCEYMNDRFYIVVAQWLLFNVAYLSSKSHFTSWSLNCTRSLFHSLYLLSNLMMFLGIKTLQCLFLEGSFLIGSFWTWGHLFWLSSHSCSQNSIRSKACQMNML